ncbi:MAG: M23 family metallopeptidase, partial [Actinobacteria bacterium]|nr:M23 family metallopeptidase [Actinomycetota bacterium]
AGGDGDRGGPAEDTTRIPPTRTVIYDRDGDGLPDTGTLVIRVSGSGPLYTCPVYGQGYYTSSFGAYRPGPPPHPHAGNDIMVPYGTPIVAPFDGVAVAVQSSLGGLGVKVFGRDGYVYNAHLSAYGKLGPVSIGDVVGFVGNTGNAQLTAPHDHFEWHPGNGPAVDPFPLLNQVC